MITRKHYFIFSLIWFTVILFLSILPSSTSDTLALEGFEMRLDYLLHFLIYFPIGFAMMRWNKGDRKSKEVIYTIILLLFFSMVPELLQYFIPYRTFNPFDLLFNMAGTIVGCLTVILIVNVRRNT